ncbi:MAG: hypothetical protein II938_04920 [Alphaproteobacteria bacterium]|nr:hypothetical protein [Alphaproteobacteria bacterium]
MREEYIVDGTKVVHTSESEYQPQPYGNLRTVWEEKYSTADECLSFGGMHSRNENRHYIRFGKRNFDVDLIPNTEFIELNSIRYYVASKEPELAAFIDRFVFDTEELKKEYAKYSAQRDSKKTKKVMRKASQLTKVLSRQEIGLLRALRDLGMDPTKSEDVKIREIANRASSAINK